MRLKVRVLIFNLLIPLILVFIAGATGSYFGLLSNVYATKEYIDNKYQPKEDIEKIYLTKAESNINVGNYKLLNGKVDNVQDDVNRMIKAIEKFDDRLDNFILNHTVKKDN